MGHFLPYYIRYAAYHEFDGIWLDLEHRAMDQREVQSVLSMCHQHDIDARWDQLASPDIDRLEIVGTDKRPNHLDVALRLRLGTGLERQAPAAWLAAECQHTDLQIENLREYV